MRNSRSKREPPIAPAVGDVAGSRCPVRTDWERTLEITAQVTAEFLCPECERVFGSGYERCPFDGARLVNLGAGLAPGTVIDNRYTIKKLLGKGGMGSVYVARQHSMDRNVAIKIMHHRADGHHASVQRFFWEVRAARRLQSPHTITVFDFGQTERGSLYLAMELLKGTTLGHLLSVAHHVTPKMALRICVQICRSLEEAHSKGIIHRDLKPENIFLVARNGQRDFVKVLDFGVAKFLDPDDHSSLTQTGTVFGTPRYMSPEQANSEPVDARSDLYSLGIIVYEMLTGKAPFNEDNALELLYKQVHAKPMAVCEAAPRLALDARVGEIVDALLEKRREDRPQSATAVREAIEALIEELPEDVDAPPPPPPVYDTAPEQPAAQIRPPREGIADTQQALAAREELRREMETPSLGVRTSHDGRREPLVGRAGEAAAARRTLERGLKGPHGAVLFVSGEPGLGKTRMTRWLVGVAQKELRAVLAQGRPESARAGDDMPEIRSAIEHLLGTTLLERAGVYDHLVDHPAFGDHVEHDLIAALTDWLRPPLNAHADEATDKHLLFSAVTRLLVRVSKIHPVVIDVGSLNDAAPLTLRFLEQLTSALPYTQARLAVIARVETSSKPREQSLDGVLDLIRWAGARNDKSLHHVVMRRLEGREFCEFLQGLGKVYINLVDYLHYLSGGVPAVAAALVRQIEAEPDRLKSARTWHPIGRRTDLNGLPKELVDAAERKLDRGLDAAPDARAVKTVMRYAALIGQTFDVDFLEDCIAREESASLLDTVEDALEVMVNAGCIHETPVHDVYRFDTGILREVIIARIRSRRAVRKLHQLVAEAIADLPSKQLDARALELANHYECAGEASKALEMHLVHARRARADAPKEAALQAYTAASEAADALAEAGEAVPVPIQREILAELAAIHFELGLYEQAASSFQRLRSAARESGDALELARAERGLGEVQDALAEFGAAADLFKAAGERFAQAGEDNQAAWCTLKRSGSIERRGNLAEARVGYQQARETFARHRDRRGLAEAHNALGLLALREGDASEALRQLRRAADLFRNLDACLDFGKALYDLAQAATERRDLLMALDAANKALEIFDREDYRVGISQCLGAIAQVLVTQRRPAEARPYFERALRIRESLGDRRGVAEAIASLGDIAFALDQYERALELSFRARDIYSSIGEFLGAAKALRTMGQAQAALGRHEDALSYLHEAVATYDSLSARDDDFSHILQSLAECQQTMGLMAEAKDTLTRALDMARDIGLTHHTGHLEARLRALARANG